MQEGGSAPVKEVILKGAEASLDDIPVMMTSERDGGPFIASGMAILKDPETGIRNMSIHRMQVMGKDKAGFVMLPRQARRIYDKYCAKNQPMPVAMVYGAHPAIFFGSAFTTQFGVDELSLAGGLIGEPIRMVKCETIDVEVPAEGGPTGRLGLGTQGLREITRTPSALLRSASSQRNF